MAEDWRDEIDWRRLRRVLALHAAMWVYGAVLAALYLLQQLDGPLRTALGAFAYLCVAAAMISGFTLPRRNRPPRPEDTHSEGTTVSLQTFLLLFAFILSACGFILLLTLLGMGTIEL